MPLKILLLLVLFIPQVTYSAPYPATLWSSDRIPDTLIGVRVLHSSTGDALVSLSSKRVTLYKKEADKLLVVDQDQASRNVDWIKLITLDLDGDGTDEIIVNGLGRYQVSSTLFSVEEGKIKKLAEVPMYLNSFLFKGKKILVGQKKLGGDDFSGPLLIMQWESGKLVKQGQIDLPGGLSGESMSLFSVVGMDVQGQSGLLYLNTTNQLVLYVREGDKWSKSWSSGETYGGNVFNLNQNIKNSMNEIVNKRFFIPVSFHINQSDKQANVFVMKNNGYLNNVIGAVPAIKNAQLFRLDWTEYGFQETGMSPRLDGAITDFDLIDWNGDGTIEIIASFLLRDKGYADTLKKQDSLLIVIKIPN